MRHLHTETVGAGVPIVMVHGWAMHGGIWRAFAQALGEYYRVILVDLPGHGRSAPLPTYSLDTLCSALLDAAPDEGCCWLGWSLGAEICIGIASRFPERVNKLILLAGTPCFVKKTGWPGMDRAVLHKFGANLERDGRATLLSFLALQVRGLAEEKSLLKELKSAVFDSPAPDTKALRDCLEILDSADLRYTFSRLQIPVAAILGTLDMLVPVAVVGPMQKLLPDLDLTVLERAGHVPFLSHQTAVLAAIGQFMGST